RRPLLSHQPRHAVLRIPAIPGVERRAVDAQLRERATHREVRAFHQPDHLRLLGRGQPHVSSPESEPVTLFFSRRFSSTVSASTCLRRPFSSRSAFTSGAVASRVVSPSSRFLPASRNSLLQR